MRRSYDVVVVGCGPAGNTLGYRLAGQGVSVLLLEKETLPRDKVCGGGLSRKTLSELPYSIESVCERKIAGAFLTGASSQFVYKALPGVGVMVRRDAFDHFMAAKAVQAGAHLVEGCGFESYEPLSASLKVRTTKGGVETRVLVGADGVYSRVRRQLYPSRTPKTAPAIEALVRAEPAMLDTLGANALFDLGVIPGGYGWIFPKKDHFNVGLYRYRKTERSLNMKKLLEEFLQASPLLRNHREVNLKALSIPVRAVAPKLAKDNVLLVGDAAGLAEGFYGEGIHRAVRSANLAAESILDSLNRGTDLADYDRKIRPLRVQSLFSDLMASVFYALPPRVCESLVRNVRVNDLFAGLLMGSLTPARCFLNAAGLLPVWLWGPWHRAVPLESALKAAH